MKIVRCPVHVLLLLYIALTTACSSDGFNMGGKFLDTDIRTVIIDTCSIRMSTVSIDSMVTSGKNSVMAGSYSDTTFGRTECIAYMAFDVPSTQDPPDAEIKFDSIALVMSLNGVWTGDTTKYQLFNIYPLDEVITLPDDEEFYSTRQVSHGSVPMASFSLKPHPLGGEAISVRLPDSLGTSILHKIMSYDEVTLGSQDRFMAYLKGFTVTGGEGSNNILGINVSDTSMCIRIYYHYSTETRHEEVISITPLEERCFYGVTTDWDDTPFEGLKGHELPSSETENMVLVQSLTASYVKIEFPYLNNLLELGDFGTVINAELLIYPVKGTYSNAVPLPSGLTLYISDEDDVAVSAITNYSGDALQTGDMVVDALYNIETYYSYNITTFLADQLGNIGINKRNLQLIVPEDKLATSLNTLVAGDASHERGRIKLKIRYLIYDSK
jgi:hypothetical protein